MDSTAVPSRITIDFRDAMLPSRTWILGVDETSPARVDLIAFHAARPAELAIPRRPGSPPPRPAPLVRPTALVAECACPEFCERDHDNE